MTFLLGANIGAAGSALWQLVSVNEYRIKSKRWPWHDSKLGTTIPSFIYSALVKLVCAYLVTGFAAYTNQISGPWAAAITGMVADNIVTASAQHAKRRYARR